MQTTTSTSDKSTYDKAVKILQKELCDEKNRLRYIARKPHYVSYTEAEDALNDVIVKLLLEFNEYDDEKFKDFISRPAAFITRAFRFKAIDNYKAPGRRRTVPQSDALSHREDGPINLWDAEIPTSEELRAQKGREDCISGIVECLAERGRTGQPKTTSLNDKDLEAAALAYRLELKQREIAKRLGETESTTSKRLKDIRDTVRLTIYLAGALGRVGSLPLNESSYEACDRHLDSYESLLEKQDKTRLLGAAPSLFTRPGVGTRIIAEEYLAKTAKEAADLKLSLLHDSETTYAKAVDNPSPRCVTVCQAHNPDGPNRPLEIAQ